MMKESEGAPVVDTIFSSHGDYIALRDFVNKNYLFLIFRKYENNANGFQIVSKQQIFIIYMLFAVA